MPPTDMPRIDPSIICYKLFICLEAKLVKQKLGKMNAEHLQVLSDEVD